MSGKQMIERVWSGPIDLIWELWTTAEGVASWFGPRGFTVEVEQFELREGGAFVYVMRSDGAPADAGRRMVSTVTVVEPPHTLVYESPFGGESMTTAVTFSEVDGGVRMVLTIDATKPEMTGGATKGWMSSLERFAERVAQPS